MKSKIIKKFSSQKGESIGETLVALLISALALMMLAGAISSGMRIVSNSKTKIDEYYKENNNMVSRTGTPDSLSPPTVTIKDLLPGNPPIQVKCWKNGTFSTVPVISYTKSK